jgi:hypothetical protein
MNKSKAYSGYLLALLGIVALAAMITFGSTSCGTRHHPDELNKIDSLIVINDKSGHMLAEVDTIQAIEARKIFAENWKKIREVVESIDDVESVRDNDYWAYITQYESYDRSLKKHFRKFNKMKSSQQENAKQLSDLFTAVKRDQIPEDSIPLYIRMETIAVLDLQMQVEQLIPQMQGTIRTLDSLHQYADEAYKKYRILAEGKRR